MSLVRTKSVIQGVAAAISFDPDAPLEESLASMAEAIGEVKTLAVARAERDSSLKGMEIGKGDYFSLLDGEPLKTGSDLDDVVVESIGSARGDEDVLAMYYGADVAESDAEALAERVRREFDGLEVELHEGGQPHYPFYISLE